MELIKQILIVFIKGLSLLLGIALLIGGGLCSLSIPVIIFSEPPTSLARIITGWGLAFIIAVAATFAGYRIIRFIFTNKNNTIMDRFTFLQKTQNIEAISFDETMAMIDNYYRYQPTEFSNGIGDDKIISPAGINQGSCKIFAFGLLQQLTPEQTLNLFGNYYHIDVLNNPNGTDHQNIRLFMKYGWNGIEFKNQALIEKNKH